MVIQCSGDTIILYMYMYIPSLSTAAAEETDGQVDAEKSEHKVEAETEGGLVDKEPGDKTEAEESDLNKPGDTEQGANSSNEDKVSENVDVQSDANSQSTTEYRSSYELAAEEGTPKCDAEEGEIPAVKVEEAALGPHPQDTKQQRKKAGGKRIARSTSSPSAGARIRLQESMGLRAIPGVGAAHSPLLLRSSISTGRCGLSASFPSPDHETAGEGTPEMSRMAKLLESEAQTGSYSCPLVGCIPASALKYFAENEERKQLSTSPQSSTSPSLVYEQSGVCIQCICTICTYVYTYTFNLCTFGGVHSCGDCLLSVSCWV